MKCLVKNTKKDFSSCTEDCEGMMVTSYYKSKADLKDHKSVIEGYRQYKGLFKFNSGIRGLCTLKNNYNIILYVPFQIFNGKTS